MTVSWPERARHDRSLQAFIDAEIARAGIDVQSYKAEYEKDQQVIQAQQRKIRELEQALHLKKSKNTSRA